MAKRKLTRRQAWRIQKIQEERQQRAQRRQSQADNRLASGELGEEREGLLIANYGASVVVEAPDGSHHHCQLRQNLESLVVGDRVVWQPGPDQGGVVSALLPRTSLLRRHDEQQDGRPIAANIDQVLIVAAPLPLLSTELIDQYLVAAELTGLRPLIVLNKIDLLDDEALEALLDELALYQELGYPLIPASTKTEHGLDTLIDKLKQATSIFVGQSGVGKSSLVKALLPEVEIRINSLSEGSGLGRHTTSASRLYHLPQGGAIIDSPGVREFRLWRLAPEAIAEGFVEFRPLLGRCRFRDCRHRQEPGCALKAAVEAGNIDVLRFENYHRIIEALEENRLG